MTQQYLRKVQIAIEGGATWTYDGGKPDPIGDRSSEDAPGLKMTFEITQADTSTPNVARVAIYNLANSSTQPAFFRGKTVTVSAGYTTGPVYVLFKGEIQQARNLKTLEADTILALLATDKSTPRNFAVVNETLSAGHTYYDRAMVCANAMKALGASIGYIDKDALTKTKFTRGCALHGNAKDHLREIAFATHTSWSIQNGKLQILANDKALPGGDIILNSKTGLIGMPVQTIQGIEGVALINGLIVPGSVVRIDQRSIQQAEYDPSITGEPNNKLLDFYGIASDGKYKVIYVSHAGDTRGEPFYTNFVCVRLSAGSVSPAMAARGIGNPTNGR